MKTWIAAGLLASCAASCAAGCAASSPSFHCLRDQDETTPFSACALDAEGCESLRVELVREGAALRGVSSCQDRPRAVCFTYFDRFTGIISWSCHDEQRDCDRFRSFMQQHRRYELRRVTPCTSSTRDSMSGTWQMGSYASINMPEPPWTIGPAGEWKKRKGPVGAPGALGDLAYPPTGEPELSFSLFALPYAVGVELEQLPALAAKQSAVEDEPDEVLERRAAELGGLPAIEVLTHRAVERFVILPSGLAVVASCQGYEGYVFESHREPCNVVFDAVSFTE